MLSDSVKCTFSVIVLHINQWLLRGRSTGRVEDGIKKRHVKAQKRTQPIHLHAQFERDVRICSLSQFTRNREADNWREDILFL